MTADSFLFWLLAVVTLVSGLSVILLANPIYSALCLAMTMVGVSALFATLGAYFIAGVQMIVYAGAVLVLFIMVLMLFDLKTFVADEMVAGEQDAGHGVSGASWECVGVL